MAKYKINKGFIQQKLGDKTVIFDGEESTLYTFNETASVIFKKLKSGCDEKEITEFIIKKYKVSQDTAKKDVSGLISDLKKKGIITHGKK